MLFDKGKERGRLKEYNGEGCELVQCTLYAFMELSQ
jgi:hypothetical protein